MNKDFIIIVGHKTTKIIDIRKDNCVYEFDSVSKIIVDNLDKEEDEIVNIIIKEYPNISKINIINDYKDFIEELNQIGITKETSKKVIVKNNDANISYCVIEITNKCCFKCDHCYIPNNNNYIDFETYQKIIDELSSINCNEILITGGEPMLHPRFDEMYLYAKNKGFLVSINSNLFLLNKKTLSILTKFKPRILEVSIYGTNNNQYELFTHVPNSYEIVINNINKLINNEINVGIKTVLTKKTKDYIYKIKEYAENNNLPFRYDYIIFPKLNENVSNKERLSPKEIVQVLKKDKNTVDYYKDVIKNKLDDQNKTNNIFKCSVGKDRIFITSDLSIQTCLLLQEKYNYNDYSLIESITTFNKEKEKMEYNKNNKCKSCNKKLLCRYCPGRFFLETGSYQIAPKFYCDLADEIIKEFKDD